MICMSAKVLGSWKFEMMLYSLIKETLSVMAVRLGLAKFSLGQSIGIDDTITFKFKVWVVCGRSSGRCILA